MAETNWIDGDAQLAQVAAALGDARWVGIDTEFMRERTFFPRLCLVQISAAAGSTTGIWLIDTLRLRDFTPLLPALTAPSVRKIVHAARQDLEALYLHTRQLVAPVFDTQIAAGCIGLKAQLGYADLANTLLGVTIGKSQTRTDWARRPLSTAQLVYAAEDVRHLPAITARLEERLDQLGRTQWAAEDCAQLANPALFDPDPRLAWKRLKGLSLMPPLARRAAVVLAVWREGIARDRDLPRSWILSDAGLAAVAQAMPDDEAGLGRCAPETGDWTAAARASLLAALSQAPDQDLPIMREDDARPTPEQKERIHRLARVVDERARALGMSAEILAPRGELRTLALSDADPATLELPSLRGWRRAQIGEELLATLRR